MWWSVNFGGGEHWITDVRIRNRRDCCGNRLASTKVMVGNKQCGSLPSRTQNGKWYTVKCSSPIRGGFVKLILTRNEYLSISGIEIFAAGRGRTSGRSRGGGTVRVNSWSNI